MDVFDLAIFLTVYEFRLLKCVPFSELHGLAWNKKDSATTCPHATRFIQHFNNVSYWISGEISEAESVKEQAKRIERYISLGKVGCFLLTLTHCAETQGYGQL